MSGSKIENTCVILIKRGIEKCKIVFHHLIEKMKRIKKIQLMRKQKLVLVAGIIAILILLVVLFFSGVSKHALVKKASSVSAQAVQMQQQNSQEFLDQQKNVLLTKIESQVATLSEQANQGSAATENHQALEQLARHLSAFIQTEQAAEKITQDREDALRRSQATISEQNFAVSKQLAEIHKAVAPQQYLPIRVLPFRVEGMSFWNGAPMVTIAMAGVNGQSFYKLIGKGEAYGCAAIEHSRGCSSWIVQSININTGVVIFKNHNNQMVRVSL